MSESPTMQMIKGGGKKKTASKKKAVAKKKAATKKKAVVKEEPVDLIADTVNVLENVSKEEALAMVTSLIEESEFNNFKVGGLLSMIQENGWWEGHENFRAFIEEEYGMPYRKAMYLINIYNTLVESGVSWEQVKSVPWTKLKEIAGVLTPDNVEKWVQMAEDMTTLQLIEYVKQEQSPDKKAVDGEGEDVTQVTTMTFKLHEDQKETVRHALDKAKEDDSTEFDAVALEYIAMQYIEGTLGKPKKVAKQKTMNEQMKKAGIESVAEAIEELWPEITMTLKM